MLVGESKHYVVRDTPYDITLASMISDGSTTATFTINGNSTGRMFVGESYTVAGGRFDLTDILYQDYAGGVHRASFCLAPRS